MTTVAGRRTLGLLLLLSALLVGCGSESRPSGEATSRGTRVTDVDSVLALRAAFNEDRGKPRLLLLLAPT